MGRTWSENRLLAAIGGAAVLAVLALVVSAGAFGAPQAAAGLPPVVGTSVESFSPNEPVPQASDAPSVEPSGDGVPSPNGSPTPSFEPVPTGS
jgi:hypothetical protein